MEITWILLAITLASIIWFGCKITTLLEQQKHDNNNYINQQNHLEQKLTHESQRHNDLFQQFLERLHKIDAAQTNIEQLATSLGNFEALLADKRTRGAFGETQLTLLVNNLIPKKFTQYQHTLTNGKRADCLVVLPAPINPIVIDAKFPLENFKLMQEYKNNSSEYLNYKRLFKKDIKQHIDDIASKYILPPETADSAIMFIPAEAIFSEIHAYNPDIVEYSHSKRVWLTSPSTIMAILTTAASVIKDDLTQKNMHDIRLELQSLGHEFERFESRLQHLFRHISNCQDDANKVGISAQKLISKFQKISKQECSQD